MPDGRRLRRRLHLPRGHLPERPRRRRRALKRRLLLLLSAVAVVRCASDAQLDPSAHAWGRFGLCLHRVNDTCHAPGDACATLAQTPLSPLLGARLEDGTFFWTRPGGLDAGVGRQKLERFEVVFQERRVATVCGCEADVKETIRGAFSTRSIATSECASDPGDPDGCTADGGPGLGTVYGERPPGDDWLAHADGGFGPELQPQSLSAWIVDEVTPASGSCPCLPCRVEYEAVGRP